MLHVFNLARLQTHFKPHIVYLGGYFLLKKNLYSSNSTATFPLNSFNHMSISPSPELKSLFEAALNEFENRTGTNLVQHQVINKLVNCQSADSVIDLLQEQAKAFRNFRRDDGRVMTWLKQIVDVLHNLSTSGVLGEGIGLVRIYSFYFTGRHHRNTLSFQPVPPAKAIFAGIGMLLGVCVLISFSQATLYVIYQFFPPGDQGC